MNRQDLQKLAEAYSQVHEKKDDSYLETNMKKRQENNEKARKEMAKVKGQKNPHFEQYTVTNADKKGNTTAYQNYKKGVKGKDGKPLYKAADHMKEGTGMHRDAKTGEVVDKAEVGKTYYPNMPKKKSSVALRKEKEMKEGVRDINPEKGTAERKARLEKKRGMKLDDHPQYKKEEVEVVAEADTSDENRNSPAHKDRSNEGLSDRQIRMKKFAQKRAQMLVKKEEVEVVDENLARMAADVTDALPWNRNTKYTTKGELRKPGENVHGQQTGRGLNTSTSSMGVGGTNKTTPKLTKPPALKSTTVAPRTPLVATPTLSNSYEPEGEQIDEFFGPKTVTPKPGQSPTGTKSVQVDKPYPARLNGQPVMKTYDKTGGSSTRPMSNIEKIPLYRKFGHGQIGPINQSFEPEGEMVEATYPSDFKKGSPVATKKTGRPVQHDQKMSGGRRKTVDEENVTEVVGALLGGAIGATVLPGMVSPAAKAALTKTVGKGAAKALTGKAAGAAVGAAAGEMLDPTKKNKNKNPVAAGVAGAAAPTVAKHVGDVLKNSYDPMVGAILSKATERVFG